MTLSILLAVSEARWSSCFADDSGSLGSARISAYSNFFYELKKPGNMAPEKITELKSQIVEPAERAHADALGAGMAATSPKPPRPGQDWDRDPRVAELKSQLAKDVHGKNPASVPPDYWNKMRGQLATITGSGPAQAGGGRSSADGGQGQGAGYSAPSAPAKEEVVLDGKGIAKEIEFSGKKSAPLPSLPKRRFGR